MTTADKTLTEQIARALTEHHHESHVPGESACSGCPKAVLPIIRQAERDAAREALDGLIANMTQIANGSPDPLTRTSATITARLAGEYKLNVYPEETP